MVWILVIYIRFMFVCEKQGKDFRCVCYLFV